MEKEAPIKQKSETGDVPELGNKRFEKSLAIRGVELVSMAGYFILLVGVFSLPVVFHFTDSTKPLNLTLLQERLFSIQHNTSQLNQTQVIIIENNTATPCETHEALLADNWVRTDLNNSAACPVLLEAYSGSVCRPYLQAWKSCALKDNELIINTVAANLPQNERENVLTELNTFLNSFPDCQSEALPFLCQYYFPLIDCETGKTYQSSREECLRVSTGVCGTLWQLAIASGYSLPVCSDLQQANSSPSSAAASSGNQTVSYSVLNITYNTTELECRKGFTVINATCHPRCDEFMQNSFTATIFLFTTELLMAIVLILTAVPIGVFFIKNQARVFSYPSFLIVFTESNLLIQAILIIISGIDRNELFCSSPGVIESVDEPTPFTIISGVIHHYLIINLVLWWFFHLIMFGSKQLFPSQFFNMTKRGLDKYIGLCIVILCILAPFIPILVAMTVERHAYRVQRLPAGLPVSSNTLWFYSIVFLHCILLTIGLWVLGLLVWRFLKQKLLTKNKFPMKQLSIKADWSQLLYFVVTAVYLIIYTAYSSVWTVNYNNLTNNLGEYFFCEALGPSEPCSRENFEKYSFPYFEGLTKLCLIIVQVGIIVFAIKHRGIDTGESTGAGVAIGCCDPPTSNNVRVQEKTTTASAINPAYVN